MKADKTKVRMPQRSEKVAGVEENGMRPIAAAQGKNPTMQPARPQTPQAKRKTSPR